MQRKTLSTVDITRIAILAALAGILYMLDFPIFPAIPFYKLDFSNVAVMLGAFAMGPMQGVLILLIKDLTGLLHSTTGGIGEVADFIMSAAFVIPGALLYRRKKGRKAALIGMLVGIAAMIIAAVLSNYYILIPAFASYDAVIGLGRKMFPSIENIWHFLFTVTSLFNLVKGAAICTLVYLLYKPLSPLLHTKKR
jgi:Predicted membrane protein